jgi:hypothetical protein
MHTEHNTNSLCKFNIPPVYHSEIAGTNVMENEECPICSPECPKLIDLESYIVDWLWEPHILLSRCEPSPLWCVPLKHGTEPKQYGADRMLTVTALNLLWPRMNRHAGPFSNETF